jgi:hypothetical protein
VSNPDEAKFDVHKALHLRASALNANTGMPLACAQL